MQLERPHAVAPESGRAQPASSAGSRPLSQQMARIVELYSPVTWLRLFLGFAVAFASGAAVALVVEHAGGWTSGTRWDVVVLNRAHLALPPWLDLILLVVPWFGTNITIFAVLIPVGVWLRRRGRADVVAQLSAAAVGNYLLNLFLKLEFARPRPTIWPRRGEYAWSSYPSGHVIAMLSVLLLAAWLLRRDGGYRWPLIVWPPLFFLTLYSRVYLAVHWPTDIIGGVAVGMVWALALWLVFRQPGWEGPTLTGCVDPGTTSAESV